MSVVSLVLRSLPSLLIGLPSLLIGLPSLLIGLPSLLIGLPSLLIGLPSLLIGLPSLLIGLPSLLIGLPSLPGPMAGALDFADDAVSRWLDCCSRHDKDDLTLFPLCSWTEKRWTSPY